MLHQPRELPGFPACIAMTLEFNQHAVYYQTVANWIADETGCGPDVQWVSDDEKAAAIRTNTVWVLHWYPSTPVGSCELAASSLAAIMAMVRTNCMGSANRLGVDVNDGAFGEAAYCHHRYHPDQHSTDFDTCPNSICVSVRTATGI